MTKNISVIAFTPVMKDVWDELVRDSRNGTFLQLRSFMDYHEDRFTDCSVIIMKGDTPVAVFPANRDASTIFSHSGITFGGLIYGMGLRSAAVRDIFHAIMDYYRSIGALKLYYKPIPYIFHRYPTQEDLYALTLNNGRIVRRDLSSVIQMDSRPKITSSRKGGISKSKKAGLHIKTGFFFGEFHELLCKVLKKHGAAPAHTEAELALLQSRFPDAIKLVGAFHGSDLMAATWIFDFGDCLHTQYLASSDKGRDVGALDFLIFTIIDDASEKSKFISFGASTEDGGLALNEGLIFQKEGFGARGLVLDHYEIDLGAGLDS